MKKLILTLSLVIPTFVMLATGSIYAQTDHTKLDYQTTPNPDEIAVRKAIEDETAAYHRGDVEAWQAGFANKPYTERMHQSLKVLAKTPYLKGENLRQGHAAFAKAHKATTQSAVLSDFEAHISGNTAWATYTQETRNASGTVVGKERGLRILEKIEGEWKIVLMSFVGF
jgi:Domain of unknown function (DUF4440)